jgi:hypothetical protein
VNTHVTATLMSRLPVPFIEVSHQAFDRLRLFAETLAAAADVESAPEYVQLQALVAELYGLSAADFQHVLSTFPLIPKSVRSAALERYTHEYGRHTEAPRP